MPYHADRVQLTNNVNVKTACAYLNTVVRKDEKKESNQWKKLLYSIVQYATMSVF